MMESPRTHLVRPSRFPRASRQQNNNDLNELTRFSAAPNGLIDLAACLSNLFSSFEILSGDPANLPLRRNVARIAWDVALQLNKAFAWLTLVQKDLNASIQNETDLVNQIMRDIAALNEKIIQAQTAGESIARLTAELKLQLHTLSESVKITALPGVNGAVDVTVGGVKFVRADALTDSLALYHDKDGNLRLRAQSTQTRLKLSGGNIPRKIAAREDGLTDLQYGLNKLTSQLIVRANAIYATRCDVNGRLGQDLFSGTDASNISVNTSITYDPAKPAKAARERRRGAQRKEMKWYQQACQDFDHMKSQLDQFRPMR